jgi:hypothetical protein
VERGASSHNIGKEILSPKNKFNTVYPTTMPKTTL